MKNESGLWRRWIPLLGIICNITAKGSSPSRTRWLYIVCQVAQGLCYLLTPIQSPNDHNDLHPGNSSDEYKIFSAQVGRLQFPPSSIGPSLQWCGNWIRASETRPNINPCVTEKSDVFPRGICTIYTGV